MHRSTTRNILPSSNRQAASLAGRQIHLTPFGCIGLASIDRLSFSCLYSVFSSNCPKPRVDPSINKHDKRLSQTSANTFPLLAPAYTDVHTPTDQVVSSAHIRYVYQSLLEAQQYWRRRRRRFPFRLCRPRGCVSSTRDTSSDPRRHGTINPRKGGGRHEVTTRHGSRRDLERC